MKTTELTDIDGDALTITQRLDGTWITCTKGAEEVTIGPIPTDAIRHAFEQPMGGDDMDGGVTAAAIEAEVVSPDRARSLVRERDEVVEALDTTMGRAIKAEREREQAEGALVAYVTAQASRAPRPLTADDITPEMIERGFTALTSTMQIGRAFVRELLEAALTPPPSHPEGAEEIEALLREIEGVGFVTDPVLLSRHLAERGVRRVTGGAS